MFSEFTGSFWKIVAAVPAGKTGRIDSCYGYILVGRVEQVHGLSEGQSKIKWFYPTEKFLERCEMRYFWKIKNLPYSVHISDIFDEFPVVLITEIFEQNEDE